MEEGMSSSYGMLYHEMQEGQLCGLHCLNMVLQGAFFTEADLAEIAAGLDGLERQAMLQGAPPGVAATACAGDFLAEGAGSHNASNRGDFSVQVLERALEVWNLQFIPVYSQAAGASQYRPELETAFICHFQNHWFCIRNVDGEWYNFNSLNPAPEHLSGFYLSAYLDNMRGLGWKIYAVRGTFPTEMECPNDYNDFGQWLTPEEARMITLSRYQALQRKYAEMEMAARKEKGLMLAIAASFRDVEVPATKMEVSNQQPYQQEGMTTAQEENDDDLKAAIAASLMPFETPLTSSHQAQEEQNLKDAVNKDNTIEEHGCSKSEKSMKED